MATDRQAGHNSVKSKQEPVGRLVVTLSNELGLHLSAQGAMNDPAFLEMAIGYLRQYTNKRWDETWKTGGDKR